MNVERHCENCHKPFSVMPSRVKWGRGRHCSRACQYAAAKAAPKNTVTLRCIGCGKDFERNPSQLRKSKGAGKYCTRACRDTHWRGKNNPNFQDGLRTSPKGSDWQRIKRAIVRRDKVCQRCGAAGKLHVHHVMPFRCFEGHPIANHPDNLVALCPPCHRREDARHKWIKIKNVKGFVMLPASLWALAVERGATGIGFKSPPREKRGRLEGLPLFAMKEAGE